MDFSPPTIFISYSRSDGRAFAEDFERRLEAEGLHAWRDLKSMEVGDIRTQVLGAIETAKQLVLILSRRALTSDWIKREWSHARLKGKQVCPILADPAISRADLPPWMRREEVFDVDLARDRDNERWKALVLVLRGDGQTKRVPYMPGDLSSDFVPRPAEYTALKAAVLAETPGKTVALHGAGGYGKTTLVNKLCRDPDVRFEFSDGIVRVEIGRDRDDVTGLICDLIEQLDPEGKRPGFTSVNTASAHLGQLIGESRLLLVIDDVWQEQHLRLFLPDHAPNYVLLVTTRLPLKLQTIPHTKVRVDEMRTAEAASLIAKNLPVTDEPEAAAGLSGLADQLGNWAQMLAIANGWLRARVEKRERLIDSIARFERRLAKDGPFVFDPKDEIQRNKAIRLCIEASVVDLGTAEAARFGELAVLPEDEDVPLSVIEALWAETGGFDEDATDDLVGRLDQLSLLQSLDLGARTLRLHDNIIWYLRDKVKPDGCRAAHAAMVRAIGAACAGVWATLPPAHVYGWRFLIRHLRAAGQEEEANRLLSDYAWIRAKLYAVGARHLFSSYLPEPVDPGARLIGRAITLSLPALADPRQLAGQLIGRLAPNDSPGIADLLLQVHQHAERPALLPIQPTLTLPDTPLIRTFTGHEGAVYALAVLNKARIVSASADRTLRIWDLDTGTELSRCEPHEDTIRAVAASPIERRALSGSMDRTLRLWDLDSGTKLRDCNGHEHWVTGVAVLPDGRQAVSASMDQTVRLWDLDSGDEVVGSRCIGHRGPILAVAVLPNGRRAFTGSMDRTARLWDLDTGTELRRYEGHQGGITAVAVLPGGSRGITGSEDRTIRIWDLDSGKELKRCTGHEDWVTAVAALPNGRRAISGSEDGTMRLWDLDNGTELSRYKGQQGAIMAVAALPDGRRAVTASFDATIGLWDLEHHVPPGQRSYCEGHEDWVTAVAVLPDGRRAITGSQDCTVRLWDLNSGAELLRCEGHQGEVRGVAVLPDGRHAVSTSEDRTIRLWDLDNGNELRRFEGHQGAIRGAAALSNGRAIVSVSDDFTDCAFAARPLSAAWLSPSRRSASGRASTCSEAT